MAQFSLAEFPANSVPPHRWFLKPTLPNIALALADFFIGQALYDLTIKEPIQKDTATLIFSLPNEKIQLLEKIG